MKIEKRIKFLKFLVYIYVICLGLTGVAQILIGGYILWDHVVFNRVAQNNFWIPSTLMILVGLVTFLLCWLGWTSTTKKRYCYLGLFSTLLVILLLVQFLICFWAYSLRNTLIPRSTTFEYEVDNSFESFLSEHFKYKTSHIWNSIQEEYKCCGVDGPSDYRRGASAVPWSCCSVSKNAEETGCTSLYQRGCLFVIVSTIKNSLLYCIFVSFVTAVLQSVGLFCSIQLLMTFRRQIKAEELELSALSMSSFRHKLEHDLKKPLSTRTRESRKEFLGESSKQPAESISSS